MIRIKKIRLALSMIVLSLLLVGCGFNKLQSSPDVIYSDTANTAKQLQVPPDLSRVNNGEQFILPGNEPGSLSRNRLLPTFKSIKYVRKGEQNWLELSQPVEAVWPILLDFIKQQSMVVEKTAPTRGLIFTQWSSSEDGSGGLLKNLIAGDAMYSRFAFRLERVGNGTRLFTRSMQLKADAIKSMTSNSWPASSHNPEQVSEVLTRLLVYFGAEEQKVRGILTEAQARASLDEVELQTTAAGTQMVVHKGFAPSFNDVQKAVEKLGYKVLQSNDSLGRMQVLTEEGVAPLLISLSQVHLSAVRVRVLQADGSRLVKSEELALLSELREQII